MTPTASRPRPARIVPMLAALAGVVVAHVVDYMVLFPSAGQRLGHLDATGHAYWPVAVGAAVGAAAVVLMLVGARGALGLDATGVAVRDLLVWQWGAFALMEVSERLVAGVPLRVFAHSPEIWLGLLLQVPVAYLIKRLLGTAERVASRLAVHASRSAARRRRPPLTVPRPGDLVAALRSAVVASASRPRAPPLPAC